ncbi:protein kinase domain-containing protein [Enterobacter sp.]|uniref:protein kinase domain-containing protein n=1 Tax=Enterobacter sp. TaxID=42895 RepID=UPI00296ED81C|nr:protein kinase [Enterobacter sp.]
MTEHDYTKSIADALPPGYRFDEFEIQDVIQTTQTEIVYQAWDHQLERAIAIREFMPRALTVRSDDMRLILRGKQDHQAFSAGLAAFIKDARQLARFNHPNLVQVLRFWVQNETAYAATLFYNGITLAELHKIQPEAIDDEWIRRVLPMLCSGLSLLHRDGFVHRNLSLNSIQIQDNGMPLLLNFGISHPISGTPGDGANAQLQPGFAPLELYTNDLASQIGPWTDIYSLGAVLYTLVHGTCPPASVTRSIQDSCVTLSDNPPAGYSPALLRAIDKALALKPEDRPQSIAEFAALAEIYSGEPGEMAASKAPGTMLIPVEEAEDDRRKTLWRRVQTPVQIAAGILVGVIAGALIFGSKPAALTDNPEATPAATAAPTATPVSTTPAGGLIARIYIRMNGANQLLVNGKPQKVVAAASGYAFLQLPAGKYDITLQSGSQTHTQSLSVSAPGTWLLNPQG